MHQEEVAEAYNELESDSLPNSSEDMKILNKGGQEFLDIWMIDNLTIATGKTNKDFFAKYTCHQKRGSSTVASHPAGTCQTSQISNRANTFNYSQTTALSK